MLNKNIKIVLSCVLGLILLAGLYVGVGFVTVAALKLRELEPTLAYLFWPLLLLIYAVDILTIINIVIAFKVIWQDFPSQLIRWMRNIFLIAFSIILILDIIVLTKTPAGPGEMLLMIFVNAAYLLALLLSHLFLKERVCYEENH